jgi:L,D-transpeptidase catalytic domain
MKRFLIVTNVGGGIECGNQGYYLSINRNLVLKLTLNRRSFLGGVVVGTAALHPALAMIGGQPSRVAVAVGQAASSAIGPTNDLISQARLALAHHGPRIAHHDIMAVVDFSVPSHEPRLHLVDIAGGAIATLLVAHGRGSDPANTGWVERFSNRAGSNASSSGSFLTGETYFGKHGKSRKLIGLDPQNDAAESRAIVIHSASYVSEEIVRDQGRIGRSQGCFAVSQDDLALVMAQLGTGRLLFAGKA